MDDRISNDLLKALTDSSYLFAANAPFIEELYSNYLEDPNSVSQGWRSFFERLNQSAHVSCSPEFDHAAIRQSLTSTLPVSVTSSLVPTSSTQINDTQSVSVQPVNAQPIKSNAANAEISTSVPDEFSRQASTLHDAKQVAVLQLINAYRFRGHQFADTDPIKFREMMSVLDLDPAYHNLFDSDLNSVFNTGSLVGPATAKLEEILNALQSTYCGHIGLEYMHITSTVEKRWIQERLEAIRGKPAFDADTKKEILERLIAAEGLEKFLHVKYVGQKRFSLEGGESLIPLLDQLIQRSGENGVKEVVVGMAHRGRLNVLVNLVGKSPSHLFKEFEGDVQSSSGSGDVKYHQGFSSDVDTKGGPVHLTVAFNPSHLEIINPVVEGSVRARQHRRRDLEGNQVLPVLIHGDAAFAGQGVVMESLQMSQARGFSTGGTVHIIINNQIGFTTSNPLDTRSTLHCTEVAKIVQAPILHVNADDPEAVLFVTQLALDFRMTFKKEVLIDMICYRRHGHNEADEPKATQPMMYKKIDQHPLITQVYSDRLIAEGVVTAAEVDQMRKSYRDELDKGNTVAPRIMLGVENRLAIDWTRYSHADWKKKVDTSLSLDRVTRLTDLACKVPDNYILHPTVAKILNSRRNMADGTIRFDWGYAEVLAYASLLEDGYAVRLTGQDSGRGTFFHRHVALHNQEDGETYLPLRHLSKNQPKFIAIDSLLSEEAVLGFEYGFSSTDANTLVIWEAQFGDFANGAQVVIDQFISSGEAKWGKYCGLTLFLPHGYDGQGPEHSSARLERYLQLCAEENIQVCVPSTPAQMFHMLRRQMLRAIRKPLVVMTPKSLLRHKAATSALEDITHGSFENIIGEVDMLDPEKVECLLVCSGKFYYELLQARREREIENIAIIRLEQIYPFSSDDFNMQLALYPNAHLVRWCQEEPRNQGAWRYVMKRLLDCLTPSQEISYAARPPSASPAVGYLRKHLEQQKAVIDTALSIEVESSMVMPRIKKENKSVG
ncbi:MAG: 2-oxoglutarate dehydrogenase E1 component [Gammaproteobacteria bacterium]|nr:2-oxoglutarate dehydrogenase E1 component [Gammaproteobacteria bacterium]